VFPRTFDNEPLERKFVAFIHVSPTGRFQLATNNAGIDESCSNLQPGQTLCLGTQGNDCTTTHVVASSDTCDIIQQDAGVDSTVFFSNNPQINEDCLNLYIGEVRSVSSRTV